MSSSRNQHNRPTTKPHRPHWHKREHRLKQSMPYTERKNNDTRDEKS